MRQVWRKRNERTIGVGRRAVVAAVVALASLAAFAAGPAQANKQQLIEEFAIFQDCPVATAQICAYSRTLEGEFVIGNKTVPINKTVILQGGFNFQLEPQPFQGAADGNTLSKTELEVPGGLVGIAGLGGPVFATAEIAGPMSNVILNGGHLYGQNGTGLTLPIKVKLSNPVLGEECYVGTDEEPIVLQLTSGPTSPPEPNTSISGSLGKQELKAKKLILDRVGVRLVDNSFSVPGASGCGGVLAPIVDLAVDADVGLPSAAGKNTAIMSGELLTATPANVVKYKPKVKRKK
jgi:hypothetical protein